MFHPPLRRANISDCCCSSATRVPRPAPCEPSTASAFCFLMRFLRISIYAHRRGPSLRCLRRLRPVLPWPGALPVLLVASCPGVALPPACLPVFLAPPPCFPCSMQYSLGRSVNRSLFYISPFSVVPDRSVTRSMFLIFFFRVFPAVSAQSVGRWFAFFFMVVSAIFTRSVGRLVGLSLLVLSLSSRFSLRSHLGRSASFSHLHFVQIFTTICAGRVGRCLHSLFLSCCSCNLHSVGRLVGRSLFFNCSLSLWFSLQSPLGRSVSFSLSVGRLVFFILFFTIVSVISTRSVGPSVGLRFSVSFFTDLSAVSDLTIGLSVSFKHVLIYEFPCNLR